MKYLQRLHLSANIYANLRTKYYRFDIKRRSLEKYKKVQGCRTFTYKAVQGRTKYRRGLILFNKYKPECLTFQGCL
ncbi:hypothetical protein MHYP_G00335020 [Metynnis hypsauchen]